jgi:HPt (histidine-containing phosphotransfer) domain-containing protein
MNRSEYRYIDLKTLKEDTLGDLSILKMIIELFIEGIDEYVNVLKDELKNENWPELFQATHKIKPNISMFGITELVPTIMELEDSFRNEQNLHNVDELAKVSFPIFNQVKVELQTELKTLDNE